MSEFDPAEDERPGPVRDAETMLTPLTPSGPNARTQMVRKLTDIVALPSARISSNERSLAADILLHVLDKVEIGLRTEVAQRIARVPECPPALLRLLLLDDPAVAEKIAAGAESLPAALLIEAAREGVLRHRLAIARRLDLTTAVADACLAYEEIEVAKLILKREECVLSPHAVNKLVAISALNRDLQTALLRRRELEPAHGFMMFWWVDAERRRRILTRFSLDRSMIQDALSDLYAKVFRGGDNDTVVKDILILADRRHRPRGLNGEPVAMDTIRRVLAEAVKLPEQDLVESVALIGGVSFDLAGRIIRDPGGEPMAVLAKSLGVGRDAFYAFYAEAAATPEAAARAERLLAVFDSMARDFARAVLRYWDWDSNPRIADIMRMMTMLDDAIHLAHPADLAAYP